MGSMVPSGGYKGFGVGLMVEIFAAALAGANLGKDASPFSGTTGRSTPHRSIFYCRCTQLFIAVAPNTFSGGVFDAKMSDLTQAVTDQPCARLPGSRRRSNRSQHDRDGIAIEEVLLECIKTLKNLVLSMTLR